MEGRFYLNRSVKALELHEYTFFQSMPSGWQTSLFQGWLIVKVEPQVAQSPSGRSGTWLLLKLTELAIVC